MAGQQGRQDPKEAALAATRCLNPHPDQVTDPEFLASDFFDARDAVQVKYEMVRKVRAGGAGTPARRTTPRPPRWSPRDWKGWCPPGPGPAAPASSPNRSSPGPRTSWPPTPHCARRSCQHGSKRPSACTCTPGRSSERWPAAGSATPKAAELPARETRKEDNPSLSPLPSPGHAAAEPGARPDAGQVTASRGGLDARYEQLRHAALHARAQAFPLGFGVLTGKGVTAWQRALASLTVPPPAPPGHRPGAAPAHPTALPAPLAAELISALAAVALAGTITGPAP